jgi:protein TonB
MAPASSLEQGWRVDPIYPPLARQARIQGTVRFDVVIDTGGVVRSLHVVAGHPLLIPAATAAVRQYLFQPILRNGQPAEATTQVDVNFVL